MYLHFDQNALARELNAVLSAFKTSSDGYERHKDLAGRLSDPRCSARKSAKFGIVANCANCLVSVGRAVNVVWENGIPVEVSLHDGTCPHCAGKSGFHFKSVENLHA